MNFRISQEIVLHINEILDIILHIHMRKKTFKLYIDAKCDDQITWYWFSVNVIVPLKWW